LFGPLISFYSYLVCLLRVSNRFHVKERRSPRHDDLESNWKEAVVAHFKLLSQEMSEKTYEKQRETSVGIDDIENKIQTENLLNMKHN
jgi:hypothetical protein